MSNASVEMIPEAFPSPPLERGDLASFSRRLVAACLDGVILTVTAAVIDSAAASVVSTDLPVVEVLYSILFIAYGATPGMRIQGLRVVDAERQRPGIVRSIRRYILTALWILPWFFFFGGSDVLFDVQVAVMIVAWLAVIAISILDPLWMIWDEHKQMLHDKLAGTYVIRV
jgi:uncharacterized RDD family membrane protein YckC